MPDLRALLALAYIEGLARVNTPAPRVPLDATGRPPTVPLRPADASTEEPRDA